MRLSPLNSSDAKGSDGKFDLVVFLQQIILAISFTWDNPSDTSLCIKIFLKTSDQIAITSNMLSKIMFVPLIGLPVSFATALQHQFHARLPIAEPPYHLKVLAGLSGHSASLQSRQDDGFCPLGYTICNDGCMPIAGVCCGDTAYVTMCKEVLPSHFPNKGHPAAAQPPPPPHKITDDDE